MLLMEREYISFAKRRTSEKEGKSVRADCLGCLNNSFLNSQTSDKALNEASKRKIITTQESLDRSYLEMPIPPKIKFLGEPDERERMTQIVNAIIERFNSESLGFSAVADSPFFNRPLAKVRNQDRRCSDLHKGRRLSEPQIIDTGDDIESEVELFSEISVR